MTREELEGAFKREGPAVSSGHQQKLEDALVEEFDRRHARRGARRAPWLRYASALAVFATLITATQVPAEYQVEVGKRVSVVLQGEGRERPELANRIARAVIAEPGAMHEVQVKLKGTPDGIVTLVVDVWGDRLLPDSQIASAVRSAVPEVAGAPIEVESLRGQVRDTLLGKVGHQFFRRGASKEERELARQRLIEALRAREGPDAQIEVIQQGEDRYRIKVKKGREP